MPLAKLPKEPRKRLQLLVQFLSEWGPAPKKVSLTKEANAAKKRIGAMPPALKAYFELGLDGWLRTYSKKLEVLFGEEVAPLNKKLNEQGL